VPLIIALPNKKGEASRRIVELVDLYPTLAELCGLPKPPNVSGQSIAPLLKNPKASWDLPAYSVTEYGKTLGKSVRTARWHYVEWDDGRSGAMLYEHPKDPLELKNLANDPSYAKIVAEMKQLLAKMPAAKK
jgi:uncharacterized sulfatase